MGKHTPATRPWFVLMDEVLRRRHSKPPLPIASIPGEIPGPSAAVGDQEKKEKEGQDGMSFFGFLKKTRGCRGEHRRIEG